MTIDRSAENRPIEHKIWAVISWADLLNDTGEVTPLDREVLRNVLTHFGANFENLTPETEEALNPRGYSNKAKRAGIEAIWGDKYEEFRSWARQWAHDYETQTGRTLPFINIIQDGKKVGVTKISGMTQVFSQLTEYAAGTLPFEDFKLYTKIRIKNGKLRELGRSDELEEIIPPNTTIPRKISSIPSGFVLDMLGHMQTWAKVA
jgi:hypothetical protein